MFTAPQAENFEILDLSEGKINVLMQGESSHACTNEPFTARVCTTACDAHVLIRAHVTRKRG